MLAIVTGAMCFAACDDEDDENIDENFVGALVSADNDVWAPNLVGAGTYGTQFITIMYQDYNARPNTNSLYLVGGKTVGTFTDAGDNPEYYWMYNHVKETYGDYAKWQTDGMEQIITAIDMTAQTYTFTANGQVYDIEAYNENEDVIQKDINAQVNTTWTAINFSKADAPKVIKRK